MQSRNMARSTISMIFIFLMCSLPQSSRHNCAGSQSPNTNAGEPRDTTCHSSLIVLASEDVDVETETTPSVADEGDNENELFQEILSEFTRDGPTRPPSSEDNAERWMQRLMKHRKDTSIERGYENEADDTGPIVINHFDLQQFPPRRIIHRKSALELANEEVLASIELECPCDYSTNTSHYVPQEEGTRFAYLITVHNYRLAEDATYLYRAIRDTGHPGAAPIILVHVDVKFAWEDFQKTSLYHEIYIKNCTCASLTHLASIFDCQWSEWSMNHPTHWAMKILATDERFRGKWLLTFECAPPPHYYSNAAKDVFINLSGDSMPTLTQKSLSDLFHPIHGPLRKTNFVTSSSCETGLVPTSVYDFPGFWHKRKHYMSKRKRGPTISYVDYVIDEKGNLATETKVDNVTIYFGSQWMVLHVDFVEYFADSLNRTDSFPSLLKKWLQDTGKLMTDETFIPTILMNVYPYNETIPKLNYDGTLVSLPSMHAVRYERMDEHSPSAFGFYPSKQRYGVSSSSIAEETKIWGPYFLGIYDLADIKHSGALFVRKVSVYVDPNIVNILPVESLDLLPDIKWTHFKISSVPDWESELNKIRVEKKEMIENLTVAVKTS